MDEQNKNLLLATALSFAVILIWFVLFPPEPQPDTAPAATVTEAAQPPQAPSAEVAGGAPETSQAVLETETAARIDIETPALTGSISAVGGRIDQLGLNNYRRSISPESDLVTLLSPAGTDDAYYALYGWAAGNGLSPSDVPGPNTVWSVEANAKLTPSSPVTLRWQNEQGLEFQRTISVDDKFMFNVVQTVRNTSDAPIALAPYGIIARHGEPKDLKNFFILHEGLVRMSDGTLDETDYGDIRDLDADARTNANSETVAVSEAGWIGFTDHYWMTTLIPQAGTPFKSTVRYDPRRDIYQTETVLNTTTVAPGETHQVSSQLFAGAKEWETIRTYQNKDGIQKFLDSIDWGWFFFLTKPIFAVLHWLNGLIGNMGWSIIALTLLIKALLFPLAYRSYVSMAKMKELQPEMEKIKERAGEDRQKLQQEMMALYKEKKVNPASGCLPILVQIPIFFSLYKVIFVTLELRHAPWFGWIKDLSAPDPSSILNLFGLLSFAPPEPGSMLAIVSLGILPIILGVSMWLQQKLNPAPSDPTQAMIFAWMPWVFMFMLGTFASGLVIYWIANNLITFSQQYLIMRSQGVKPDIIGNITARAAKTEKSSK